MATRSRPGISTRMCISFVVAPHGFNGQVLEIRIGVDGGLATFAVDGLEEIPLAVEQAHGNERQTHVARGLAVVAGQNAEATGIDGQALVEAENSAQK